MEPRSPPPAHPGTASRRALGSAAGGHPSAHAAAHSAGHALAAPPAAIAPRQHLGGLLRQFLHGGFGSDPNRQRLLGREILHLHLALRRVNRNDGGRNLPERARVDLLGGDAAIRIVIAQHVHLVARVDLRQGAGRGVSRLRRIGRIAVPFRFIGGPHRHRALPDLQGHAIGRRIYGLDDALRAARLPIRQFLLGKLRQIGARAHHQGRGIQRLLIERASIVDHHFVAGRNGPGLDPRPLPGVRFPGHRVQNGGLCGSGGDDRLPFSGLDRDLARLCIH